MKIEFHQVSKDVNNPQNNNPTLVNAAESSSEIIIKCKTTRSLQMFKFYFKLNKIIMFQNIAIIN